MHTLGILSLMVAAVSVGDDPVPGPLPGEWWIAFSAPSAELDPEAAEAIRMIPPYLEAFPGAAFELCSTRSIAERGAERRAAVYQALAEAGVPRRIIRDAGDCASETAAEALANTEAVRILMLRPA